MVEICARTDANVLLFGETGVGKDLHGRGHPSPFAPRRLSLRQGRLHALSRRS